ncbi:MAG: 50S ribosomal protein L29 [Phycisphaerales bacterium]|nr:50S ribosomal protein L29 [Phycisphaerales bacterium]
MAVKTSEDKARIHKLSEEQIDVELKQLRARLFQLRTQAVTEKIEDPTQFRKTRREVARLLTERNARRAGAGSK